MSSKAVERPRYEPPPDIDPEHQKRLERYKRYVQARKKDCELGVFVGIIGSSGGDVSL